MKPITIIAISTAVEGQEHALRSAQQKLVAETVKEPGCLRYELHQSLDDGRILIFVENWTSESAWRAHMNGAAVRKFAATGANRFIQDFQLHRMADVSKGDQRA